MGRPARKTKPKRGPGRPKGSTSGGMEARVLFRCSAEYLVWLKAFSKQRGRPATKLVREALRHLAEVHGFRTPPEK